MIIRKLCICENELSGLLCAVKDRMNDVRIIKGSTEEGTQDYCPGIREKGRTFLRMKIISMGLIRDGFPGAIRTNEKGGDWSSRTFQNPGVHPAFFQSPENKFTSMIRPQGTENCSFHTKLCGGHGFIHCLSSHIQRSGLRQVSGGGNGNGIELANDRINQSHSDTDNIVHTIILSTHADVIRHKDSIPKQKRKRNNLSY